MIVYVKMSDGTKGTAQFDTLTALEAVRMFQKAHPDAIMACASDDELSVCAIRDGFTWKTDILSDGSRIHLEKSGLRLV